MPADPALGRGQREFFPQRSWRGLRTALAGSPVGVAESGLRCVMFDMSRYYGRVVHLRQLPTSCRHDAVAFGYRRGNVPPDGDLHPAVCTPSQAHERDVHVASTWHRRGASTENPLPRKLHTVKRPKCRAPAKSILSAVNTYPVRI